MTLAVRLAPFDFAPNNADDHQYAAHAVDREVIENVSRLAGIVLEDSGHLPGREIQIRDVRAADDQAAVFGKRHPAHTLAFGRNDGFRLAAGSAAMDPAAADIGKVDISLFIDPWRFDQSKAADNRPSGAGAR